MSDTPFSVRRATPTDRDLIVDFQLRMALESEGLQLSKETVERGVARVLGDLTVGEYLITQ